MQYKVSVGKEFFTLAKNYKGGETVELPTHEGDPFVGVVFDAPEPAKASITIPDQAVKFGRLEDTEAAPEPKHKRSK